MLTKIDIQTFTHVTQSANSHWRQSATEMNKQKISSLSFEKLILRFFVPFSVIK